MDKKSFKKLERKIKTEQDLKYIIKILEVFFKSLFTWKLALYKSAGPIQSH